MIEELATVDADDTVFTVTWAADFFIVYDRLVNRVTKHNVIIIWSKTAPEPKRIIHAKWHYNGGDLLADIKIVQKYAVFDRLKCEKLLRRFAF